MPAVLTDRYPLAGTKVLVLGIGILGGGRGVATFLLDAGAHVRASDMRPESDFGAEVAALRGLGCELHFGGHPLDDVDWADVVFRNPAVRADAAVLRYARELGKRIEMEVKFFAARSPAPLIMVTGSKGKTTTTQLLRQLLEAGSSRRVRMAGNMGLSAVALLSSLTADDLALLEVSSFQLEETPDTGWGPHIAVITNVGDDHLDRYHHSIDEYRRVKLGITAGQTARDLLVIPAWDDAIIAGTAHTNATRMFVHNATDDGAPADDERRIFVREGRFVAAGFAGAEHDLGAVTDLALLGDHNATNFMFAAGAAIAAGVQPQRIGPLVGALRPVEHRLETVGYRAGLAFIDDTTATAPMAVVAALDALPPTTAVIICGGHDKGADYEPMVDAVVAKAAGVVLLRGVGTDRFIDDLRTRAGQPIANADSMADAVAQAVAIAARVGARSVLLSPGCASFGGFRNEFDRAEQFRAAVGALPESE